MKVIFNVATIPERREQLFKTIDSIINQCDEVNIMLNLYEEVPQEFSDNGKIHCYLCDNSITDGYKFKCVKDYKDSILFFIDDDLIYPKHYAEFMISKLIVYGYNSIISLHGRNFSKFPITSYYKDVGRKVYHCLCDVPNDIQVQFAGTGVMCCHSDVFNKFDMSMFTEKSMADIIMSKYFVENNFLMYCIAHAKGYLNYQNVKETICGTYQNKDVAQTEMANSIYNKEIPQPSWKSTVTWNNGNINRAVIKKIEVKEKEQVDNKLVSFIVPAYKVDLFIEECLDSIHAQKCNKEILVGVDGCEDTMTKILAIKGKYPELKVFYFNENVGTYVVMNTLIGLSKGDYISTFGADDIMKDNFSSVCLEKIKVNDFLCCKGGDFSMFDKENIIREKLMHGTQFYKRNVFFEIGGYAAWRCGADTDFLSRAKRNKFIIYNCPQSVILRRLHENNVTVAGSCNMLSDYRKEIIEKIKERKWNGFIKESLTTTNNYSAIK